MTKFHNERLQRAFAAVCGLPINLPQPSHPSAAFEPPAAATSGTPPPATAGGSSLAHDRWVREVAFECWCNADGDIEVAGNLALKATDSEEDFRAVCGELHDIERTQDAEGYF